MLSPICMWRDRWKNQDQLLFSCSSRLQRQRSSRYSRANWCSWLQHGSDADRMAPDFDRQLKFPSKSCVVMQLSLRLSIFVTNWCILQNKFTITFLTCRYQCSLSNLRWVCIKSSMGACLQPSTVWYLCLSGTFDFRFSIWHAWTLGPKVTWVFM